MTNRPNFFILLGLSLEEAWNEQRFIQALSSKQKEWEQQSKGMGSKAQEAKDNLKLIPEINRIMRDRYSRSQEAREARTLRTGAQQTSSRQREAQLIEFEKDLAAREQKGYLDETEAEEMYARYQDAISRDEMNKQIRVPIRVPIDQSAPQSIDGLDAATLQDISEKLAQVHAADLYQLLGKTTTASQAVLCQAAEHLNDEMMQRQPRTAETAIYMSLAAYAKTIFSDDAKRERYDEYLRLHSRQATGDDAEKQEQVQPQRREIERLNAQNIGSALRLTWLWPAKCYDVEIFYSDQAWPQPGNGRERGIRVTLAEYETAGGHYDLFARPNRHYYMVVVPFISGEGRLVIERGAGVEGDLIPQISIGYEIKNPRFGYKHRALYLYTNPVPAKIPATLLLVYRNDMQPLHKRDGEILYRIPGPIEMPLQERPFPLPDTPFPRNACAKLFVEDDDLNAVVIILHPDERKLRLS